MKLTCVFISTTERFWSGDINMNLQDENSCQTCFNEVVFRCEACKADLCQNCVSVHIKMKLGNLHKIVLAHQTKVDKCKLLQVRAVIDSGMVSLCDVGYRENGAFYTCSEKGKTIRHYNGSGKVIDCFDGGKNPLCLAASSNGVLYTEFGIRAVMFYSKGRIKHLFSTGDWQPQGINLTKLGNILLTLRRKNQSKLVLYNQHGQICSEFQYHDDEPLFRDPWYIVENSKGDFCASDQGKHAVICVKPNGRLAFEYKGRKCPFYPRGICADSTSHFIIADPWNNMLHYISSCGEFICYLKYDSMDSPMGVSSVTDEVNCFLVCEISGSIFNLKLNPD